jgi:hypothetical protein
MAALTISNVAETEHALSAPLNNPEAIYKANLDMKAIINISGCNTFDLAIVKPWATTANCA